MVLFQIMVILTAAPEAMQEACLVWWSNMEIKHQQRTCKVTLTDAMGSCFRSRQKIKLKAHLAWWSNV